MIELLFASIGVMVAFFVVVGGMFWAFGFVADSFSTKFDEYQNTFDPYER